jgi:rare lipoprotein A
MTAAHKTYPIPSYARVTNVKTGRSVVVRINDRGPFHSNRIIDLSYAAAARLDIVSAGSAMVEVERMLPGAAPTATALAPAEPSATATAIETPVVSQEMASLWLQLGAFASAESAESFRQKLSRDLPWLLEPAQVSARDGLHRVRLGPYRNRDEATAIAEKVRASLGYAPLMTPR